MTPPTNGPWRHYALQSSGPLTPVSRDVISLYLVEWFQWNLPRIFIMFFKFIGQGHDRWRRHAVWCQGSAVCHLSIVCLFLIVEIFAQVQHISQRRKRKSLIKHIIIIIIVVVVVVVVVVIISSAAQQKLRVMLHSIFAWYLWTGCTVQCLCWWCERQSD